MVSKIDAFFSDCKNKKVGFIGLGISHINLIKLFLKKDINVTVFDKRSPSLLGNIYFELVDMGVMFYHSDNYLDNLLNVDIIFRSPGVNYFTKEIVNAVNKGKLVTSEMEMFFELCPCKIYAVTGSDGKTTTSSIIYELLSRQGYTVHLGGNIGKPLLPEIYSVMPDHIAVIELSSFQLISMKKSPHVAVITNITPNHLDVHKNMEEYILAKKNIIRYQDFVSKTVINMDDKISNQMIPYIPGDSIFFSMKKAPKKGVFWDSYTNKIYLVSNNKKLHILDANEIIIPGMHNIANYLAAISATYDIVSMQVINDVAKTFSGVKHRIEFVRELDGVKWYNDSIATSPTRTIAGLNSFDKPIIIIAGGYDKKIPFDPLIPHILEKTKLVILMGDTKFALKNAIISHPDYDSDKIMLRFADHMESAVNIAQKNSKPGDVVSLSPACASFDLYSNFEARGDHFKSLVYNLESLV